MRCPWEEVVVLAVEPDERVGVGIGRRSSSLRQRAVWSRGRGDSATSPAGLTVSESAHVGSDHLGGVVLDAVLVGERVRLHSAVDADEPALHGLLAGNLGHAVEECHVVQPGLFPPVAAGLVSHIRSFTSHASRKRELRSGNAKLDDLRRVSQVHRPRSQKRLPFIIEGAAVVGATDLVAFLVS